MSKFNYLVLHKVRGKAETANLIDDDTNYIQVDYWATMQLIADDIGVKYCNNVRRPDGEAAILYKILKEYIPKLMKR